MVWLESARRKLTRADEHLATLEAAMREELEHDFIQRAVTTVGEGGVTATIVDGLRFETPPTLPPAWALLIGDFASNARAALDHLAWSLAGRNTWTAARWPEGQPWPPDTLTIPVWDERPANNDQKKRRRERLSLFRPADRRHVAAVQPYRKGKRAHETPIWLLHRMRNADLHRELHTVLPQIPTAAVGALHRIVPSAEGGEEFYWPQRVRGAVEEMLEDPHPGDVAETEISMSAMVAPHVTFAVPGEDFDGRDVLPLLHECRDEVERVLGLFPG